jgi:hypothetical protein
MRFTCPWKEVARFESPVEFRSFERWMTGQVSAGMARQVPVGSPYLDGDLCVEVWYLHLKSREVWRLVWPEPPFCGLFIRVIDA